MFPVKQACIFTSFLFSHMQCCSVSSKGNRGEESQLRTFISHLQKHSQPNSLGLHRVDACLHPCEKGRERRVFDGARNSFTMIQWGQKGERGENKC